MAQWLDAARATPGRFVTVEKIEQGGSLQARVDTAGAVAFYYRCKIDGQEARVRVGAYDPAQPPRSLGLSRSGGYSLTGARARSVELALQHHTNREAGGLAGKMREQAAEKRRKRAEVEALKGQTVEALFLAYGDLLQQRGRINARDAILTLARFLTANPALAEKPAHEATAADFVRGLRALHEAGKVREPGKVRSYAHAAYRTAMLAATDPQIPVRFEAFGVTSNPLATIRATPARADKNALSADDLRIFWRIAQETEGHAGALMRLHILTGGQRIKQLLRLQREDVHDDYFVLHDAKGRRSEARRHVVPLIAEAKTDLAAFDGSPSVFMFNGRAVSGEVLLKWEKTAVGNLIEEFSPKRLRSGIETALASLGVGKDIRGQVQSHGLGGVQDRHYDDHDYLPEKRAALQALLGLMNATPADNVTPIRGAA